MIRRGRRSKMTVRSLLYILMAGITTIVLFYIKFNSKGFRERNDSNYLAEKLKSAHIPKKVDSGSEFHAPMVFANRNFQKPSTKKSEHFDNLLAPAPHGKKEKTSILLNKLLGQNDKVRSSPKSYGQADIPKPLQQKSSTKSSALSSSVQRPIADIPMPNNVYPKPSLSSSSQRSASNAAVADPLNVPLLRVPSSSERSNADGKAPLPLQSASSLKDPLSPSQSNGLSDNMQKAIQKSVDKMEKEFDNQKKKSEFVNLPNPEDIAKTAIGPIGKQQDNAQDEIIKKVSDLLRNSPRKFKDVSKKILVIALPGAGYGLMEEVFNNPNGVFHHIEPPLETKNGSLTSEGLHSLENLFQCVFTGKYLNDNFKDFSSKIMKHNDFISNACHNHEECSSNPYLVEKMCSKFSVQIVKSSAISLRDIERIHWRLPEVNFIHLTRDPRGVFEASKRRNNKMSIDISEMCHTMTENFEDSIKLISERKVKQFFPLRYEDMAVKPKQSLQSLLSMMKINIKIFEEADNSNLEVSAKSGWNLNSNSVDKVNHWKQKLSLDQVDKIENKCLDILTKMEYPIMGKVKMD